LARCGNCVSRVCGGGGGRRRCAAGGCARAVLMWGGVSRGYTIIIIITSRASSCARVCVAVGGVVICRCVCVCDLLIFLPPEHPRSTQAHHQHHQRRQQHQHRDPPPTGRASRSVRPPLLYSVWRRTCRERRPERRRLRRDACCRRAWRWPPWARRRAGSPTRLQYSREAWRGQRC